MRANGIIRAIVILIIGIAVLGLGVKTKMDMAKKPIDITDEEFSFDDLKSGDHVKADLNLVFGSAVIVTKDNKETSRIYCIPHLDENGEIDGYVGLKTGDKSSWDILDDLSESSAMWYYGASDKLGHDYFSVDGTVSKLTSEEARVFKQYLDKNDLDDKGFVELSISNTSSNATSIMLGLGGIITLIGAIIIAVQIRGIRKDKAEESADAVQYQDA